VCTRTDVSQVNIVAFVPHWLRFCYLAEIMEASLVDITYLLESGALVDFTADELVHLLLALFTDTPNRAELIGKVMARPTMN
jgi:centromere/kinetochore protein ZW10